jgi:lysyl-tRNA synthetase, class II
MRIHALPHILVSQGISTRHNPEFTSVEIYQAYADYSDMMTLTEKLIINAAQRACDTTEISYQGTPISLTAPWRRATMSDLVKDVTGFSYESCTDLAEAKAVAEKAGVHNAASMATVGEVYVQTLHIQYVMCNLANSCIVLYS